ncbi:MAG: S8 family serine peptidase, partial [Chloroflexi bacterium]|nr:S8 family serine peptidase [Chloroflexota bacterium]
MKAMRIFNLVVIILLVVAFLPAQQAVQARPATQEIPADALYVPGEVVVTFTDGLPAASYTTQATTLAGSVSAAVVRQDKNTALLSFSPDADVTALVNQIAAVSVVKTAQPNYIHRIPEKDSQLRGKLYTPTAFTTTAADGSSIVMSWSELLSLRTVQGNPSYPNESDTVGTWGWFKVGADIIWGMTASTAQVCLLDSGVDSAHPELTGSISGGYDFVNNDTKANDDNGHGTHLAGIILAKGNNGAGTAIGVAKTKIVPVKVANAQGWGTSYNIAAGIRYCANLAAVKVINLSLGGPTPDQFEYTALLTAAVDKGKLIVVAAGNDSMSYVDTKPASFPGGWANPQVDASGVFMATGASNSISQNLITVGAARDPSLNTWVDTIKDSDTQWRTIQPAELFKDCATEFTNYGDWVTLVAPGGNIYSTTPKSYPFYMNFYNDVPASYAVMSGTSQAAAFVSAAASRVWGSFTTLTAPQVKDRLVASGRPLTLA